MGLFKSTFILFRSSRESFRTQGDYYWPCTPSSFSNQVIKVSPIQNGDSNLVWIAKYRACPTQAQVILSYQTQLSQYGFRP